MEDSRRYIGVILCFLVLSGSVNAQFSRYWRESFSTKASLLSGAVVGGYQDESSIYYNPSIISDSSHSEFAFANGVGALDYVRYDNAMGPNLPISNRETRVDGAFISVNLYPKDKYHLMWKASYFNKGKQDVGFQGEYRETYDVYPIIPGEESYLGRVSSRNEYNDYWYGIGAAKFLNDKISLGISMFLRYSNLRYDYSKMTEVGPLVDSLGKESVALNSYNIGLRGFNWRGTIKLGLNYRFSDRFRGGLVCTLPSLWIKGSATTILNISGINLTDMQTGNSLPDFFYDATGTGLKMKMRDPLSIAMGLDYRWPKYRWNVTLEWFAGMSPYRFIDASKGEIAVNRVNFHSEQEESLSFVAGGKSIANIAVGLELLRKKNRSWMFGFKTDFDALKNYNYQELAGLNTLMHAKANYYHYSAGKTFAFLKYDVLFGVRYSHGRAKNLPAFANFASPITYNEENPYRLENTLENNMNFAGDAFTVFVGLTLKK